MPDHVPGGVHGNPIAGIPRIPVHVRQVPGEGGVNFPVAVRLPVQKIRRAAEVERFLLVRDAGLGLGSGAFVHGEGAVMGHGVAGGWFWRAVVWNVRSGLSAASEQQRC